MIVASISHPFPNVASAMNPGVWAVATPGRLIPADVSAAFQQPLRTADGDWAGIEGAVFLREYNGWRSFAWSVALTVGPYSATRYTEGEVRVTPRHDLRSQLDGVLEDAAQIAAEFLADFLSVGGVKADDE